MLRCQFYSACAIPEWRRLARKREREPVAARVQACIGKDTEQGMPRERKTITVRLNAFLEGIERNLENLIGVFGIIERKRRSMGLQICAEAHKMASGKTGRHRAAPASAWPGHCDTNYHDLIELDGEMTTDGQPVADDGRKMLFSLRGCALSL